MSGMSDDELISQLVQHPAWPALRKRAEERMEKHGHLLATEFLTYNKQPDYGRLQYSRGFIAGMKFLLDRPQASFREFQKELARERDEVT